MSRICRLLYLLLAFLIASCSDPSGPPSEWIAPEVPPSTQTFGDFELSLSVEPDTVGLHEEFTIEVVVRNRGEDEATLRSPDTCWHQLDTLYRGEEHVGLRGTANVCWWVPFEYTIPPGEELRQTYSARAERLRGEPVPTGYYAVWVSSQQPRLLLPLRRARPLFTSKATRRRLRPRFTRR